MSTAPGARFDETVRPRRTRRVVIWSSRPSRVLGGLQQQLEALRRELAATLRLPSVLVAPEPAAAQPRRTAPIAYRVTAPAVVAEVDAGDLVYCARLFDGLESVQLRLLRRLAGLAHVVVRCPTTDDARRLAAAVRQPWSDPDRSPVWAHCLNARSAELVSRAGRGCGLRAVLQWNTAPDLARAAHGPATTGVPAYHYAGRSSPAKNLAALCRAWQQGVPGGQGAAGPALRLSGGPDLAAYATSPTVEYAGRYHAEPPFARGDVVVLPSFREGHPNVLVEAFRAGAVVVGTRIPGVEEHLAGGRGVLIERPFDSGSIADALSRAGDLSAGARLAMGDAARRYYERRFHADQSSATLVVALLLGTGAGARGRLSAAHAPPGPRGLARRAARPAGTRRRRG